MYHLKPFEIAGLKWLPYNLQYSCFMGNITMTKVFLNAIWCPFQPCFHSLHFSICKDIACTLSPPKWYMSLKSHCLITESYLEVGSYSFKVFRKLLTDFHKDHCPSLLSAAIDTMTKSFPTSSPTFLVRLLDDWHSDWGKVKSQSSYKLDFSDVWDVKYF